jgi:hypothetical protein
MKQFMKMFAIIAMFALMVSACKQKKEEAPMPEAPKAEVYQPQHKTAVVDLKTAKKYHYVAAPMNTAAKTVTVNFDGKNPYQTILVTFVYVNGDTFIYTVPDEFGIWKNEIGKWRILNDGSTVWMQGQTKQGKFHEFIFYSDPKNNAKKIKPNSYTGVIAYR